MAYGHEGGDARRGVEDRLIEPALGGGIIVGLGASGAEIDQYLVVGGVQPVGTLERLNRALEVVAGGAVLVLGEQPAKIIRQVTVKPHGVLSNMAEGAQACGCELNGFGGGFKAFD